MIRTLLVNGLLVATLAACSSGPQAIEGWDVYGEGVAQAAPVSVASLLDDPAAYDGETLVVEGTIDEACPKKGCWMTFVHGDESMRVSFKDYGFFVPLDSAGSTARMEGTFAIREIPLDEARHYLEDAGKLDEAAALTGPQEGYEFVATGVQLQQPAVAEG